MGMAGHRLHVFHDSLAGIRDGYAQPAAANDRQRCSVYLIQTLGIPAMRMGNNIQLSDMPCR